MYTEQITYKAEVIKGPGSNVIGWINDPTPSTSEEFATTLPSTLPKAIPLVPSKTDFILIVSSGIVVAAPMNTSQ